MAEVTRSYDTVLQLHGRNYRARACGRAMTDGRWEGWLEFIPDDDSPVLRSRRETTQPNAVDLDYWAGGLTPVYLEGALERTAEPVKPRFEVPDERPVYDGPAPARGLSGRGPKAVLDPFVVYSKEGEDILRQELGALRDWHLRNIVRAFDLADERRVAVESLSALELVELIMSEVRDRATVRGN